MRHRKLSFTHEVIDSRTRAAELAAAHSMRAKYKYRANAVLAGYGPLRPYDPVYLSGIADNMSGLWVVITAVHVFNKDFPYSIRATLGTTDALLRTPKPIDSLLIGESNAVTTIVPMALEETDTFINESDKPYNPAVPHIYELNTTLNVIIPVGQTENTPLFIQSDVVTNNSPVDDWMSINSITPPSPYETVIPKMPSSATEYSWSRTTT